MRRWTGRPPQPRRLLTLDIHDETDPATHDWIVHEADGSVRMPSQDELRAVHLGLRFETWLAGQEPGAAPAAAIKPAAAGGELVQLEVAVHETRAASRPAVGTADVAQASGLPRRRIVNTLSTAS